jgi:nucleoside 2-deoxyribosyltransferase
MKSQITLEFKETQMLIYFAGPLFNQAEREFNAHLTSKLENLGFQVFLPQRDGIELTKTLLNELSDQELSKKIFHTDRNQILKANIFLMILDGRGQDEGTCVELGIAHENKYINNQKKLLIGFLTDMRVFAEKFRLNAMLTGALDYIVDNEKDLLQKIKDFSIRK